LNTTIEVAVGLKIFNEPWPGHHVAMAPTPQIADVMPNLPTKMR
jgi:hypothetical protein